jgi:hypothetical protein
MQADCEPRSLKETVAFAHCKSKSAQFLMLASEMVQVHLLASRSMIYELTPQEEPEWHRWPSEKATCTDNGSKPTKPIRSCKAHDGLGAIQGLMWALVFELGIALAAFLLLGALGFF